MAIARLAARRQSRLIDPPILSVIMACYNSIQFLDAAVESILSQTLTDFEFIIIDDASTDGTFARLIQYKEKDARIRLFQNPVNLGLATCLNHLLSSARADWVARMDADDVSLPGRFAAQMEFLAQNKSVQVLGTGVEVFKEPLARAPTLPPSVAPSAANTQRARPHEHAEFGHNVVSIGDTVRESHEQHEHELEVDPLHAAAIHPDSTLVQLAASVMTLSLTPPPTPATTQRATSRATSRSRPAAAGGASERALSPASHNRATSDALFQRVNSLLSSAASQYKPAHLRTDDAASNAASNAASPVNTSRPNLATPHAASASSSAGAAGGAAVAPGSLLERVQSDIPRERTPRMSTATYNADDSAANGGTAPPTGHPAGAQTIPPPSSAATAGAPPLMPTVWPSSMPPPPPAAAATNAAGVVPSTPTPTSPPRLPPPLDSFLPGSAAAAAATQPAHPEAGAAVSAESHPSSEAVHVHLPASPSSSSLPAATAAIVPPAPRHILHPSSPSLVQWSLPFFCPLAHPSVIFAKGVVIDAGGYKAEWKNAEDYELWTRLARKGVRMANVPVVLLRLRKHSSNASTIGRDLQRVHSLLCSHYHLTSVLGVPIAMDAVRGMIAPPMTATPSTIVAPKQSISELYTSFLLIQQYESFVLAQSGLTREDYASIRLDCSARLGELVTIAMGLPKEETIVESAAATSSLIFPGSDVPCLSVSPPAGSITASFMFRTWIGRGVEATQLLGKLLAK